MFWAWWNLALAVGSVGLVAYNAIIGNPIELIVSCAAAAAALAASAGFEFGIRRKIA